MADDATDLEIDPPGQAVLQRAGEAREARHRALLPRGRRGRAGGDPRPADRAQALRGRRREAALLPEARAHQPAGVDPDHDPLLPFGAHRGGGGGGRRGGARVGGQPRLPRAPPAPGPHRRPRPPRRAADRLRSHARRGVGGRSPRGAGGPAAARGAGTAGLAQDQRIARAAREREDPAAVVVLRGAPGRAGVLARDRAAHAGAGDLEVVEGGAHRRVPRLQPERQGSHHLLRLLGAAAARRPGLGAAGVGRSRRMRSGGIHGAHDAEALRRARRPACRHGPGGGLARDAAGDGRARRGLRARHASPHPARSRPPGGRSRAPRRLRAPPKGSRRRAPGGGPRPIR